MTESRRSLDMPLYASKPQRKIPGTDCVAVTFYASQDRTVRQYVIFNAEGESIGHVQSHSKRLGLSAGYHEGHRAYDHRLRTWSNLTEAARTFLAEKKEG